MQPNHENNSLLHLGNGYGYGTVIDAVPISGTTRQVIYCVHGRPSAGCCTVLEEQIIESDGTYKHTTPTRENSDATLLVNQHCHQSQTSNVDGVAARKKLILASILCLIFMVAEILGGYLSNSLAIASDAAHLLTDFASFMISLFSIWMSNRPSTKRMPFGWYRAEVIGALTSVLMIWLVTGVLVYLAVLRVIHQTFEIDAKIMLITSSLGVIVNLIMGLTLHQHGHSHSKRSDGSQKNGSATSSTNINVRAALIHVIGDFIQSFGVFVAALVMYFKSDWIIIDPICTFAFSILVLLTTFAIVKDTLMVLMEGSPKGIDFTDVLCLLSSIEGVKKVHNLRIWALSLDKIAMSAHIAISSEVSPQQILMIASKNIHDRYNFFEMTLQIEEFQDAMNMCNQCKNPS